MAVCPHCQTEIQIQSQHHGTLYTCSHCGAVFFVDWNGQPEIPSEVVGETPPTTEEANYSSNDDAAAAYVAAYNNEPASETPFELPPAYLNENTSMQAVEAEPVEEAPLSADFEAPLETPAATDSYDFSQPIGEPAPIFDEAPDNSADSSNFSDIADFGNSDLSQSAFTYSVEVKGIDTATVRASIHEILSESKFGWNVVSLMAQIKDGVLTIKSVNGVKASILVKRLKYLPVRVSWRQDVLSSTI